MTKRQNKPGQSTAPAPAPQPVQGGSFIRQPDGTLVPEAQITASDPAPKDA
ncbi:MAG: hypothetical protein R3D60_13135 [Paracoccaceae bacterium]